MAAGASPSPFTPAPALASSMAALPPLAPMPAASPAPSSSPSLGFDGGDPVAAGTDGAGSGEGGRRVDAGSDGGGEPQPCKDGGSQPHPATDGDGGKKPQCNRRKNLKESSLVDTIIKEKNQKVVKANDKIEKKVLPLKEKNQKVVKANEKIEKNVEKKASQKQVGAGKLPQVGADKPRSKKREANIRNIKSASPLVENEIGAISRAL